jgi:membrane protein YqaA with SNARE-associated domain
MKGILATIGITIGGAIGWWLGDFIGLTSAIILSSIGSGAGLLAIRWLAKEYLD